MTMRIAIDIPSKIVTVLFLGTISILGAPSSATILGFLPTTHGSRFACSSFLSSLAWFPLSRLSTIGLVLSFHVISSCVHEDCTLLLHHCSNKLEIYLKAKAMKRLAKWAWQLNSGPVTMGLDCWLVVAQCIINTGTYKAPSLAK